MTTDPTTEHAAICYDCSFHGGWKRQHAEADDDRMAHEDANPSHKIRVMSRASR